MSAPTLVLVEGRDLVFSDGRRLKLPDAVNVAGHEPWPAARVATPRWLFSVPGKTGEYERRVQLEQGVPYEKAVIEVAYLRRCVRQEAKGGPE